MNRIVPTYSLYGESIGQTPEFWMHAESIASRSRLHDWEIRRHRHEALFQILHIHHGECTALLGGRQHRLTGPCFIIVPERHEHGFRFSHDIDGTVITILARHFAICRPGHPGIGDWLARPLCGQIDPDHPDAGYLTESLNRLVAEIMQGTAGPVAMAEACLVIVLMLLRRMDSSSTAAEKGRDQARYEALVRLIHAGFRTHRPVATYARELGVSATHLNRISHAVAGKPVSHLIAERIVNEAKRDLVFADVTIQQIAESLGFEDQAYFSRFFARHAGIAPRTYRERERALLNR